MKVTSQRAGRRASRSHAPIFARAFSCQPPRCRIRQSWDTPRWSAVELHALLNDLPKLARIVPRHHMAGLVKLAHPRHCPDEVARDQHAAAPREALADLMPRAAHLAGCHHDRRKSENGHHSVAHGEVRRTRDGPRRKRRHEKVLAVEMLLQHFSGALSVIHLAARS